ncbi:hypothetical protein HDU98_001026 [Podochytrium sp. JEL0797]|nr:hypothetical protein HDU98_001026 [Podochytrium sp. JEL0797]
MSVHEHAWPNLGVLYVAPWITATVIISALPLIHFSLLRFTLIPHEPMILVCLISHWIATHLFPCTDPHIDAFAKIGMTVYFGLRMLEMGALPRSETSKWGLREYIEFIITASNAPVRRQATSHHDAWHKAGANRVAPRDRTARFYLTILLQQTSFLILYSLTQAYFKVFPLVTPYVGNVSFFDAKRWVECGVLGLMGLSLMELGYTVPALVVMGVLEAPFVPLFRAPWRASSLRDFVSFFLR